MKFIFLIFIVSQFLFAEVTPLSFKVEEEKVTKIACTVKDPSWEQLKEYSFTESDIYHYFVLLPKGYYKDAKKGHRYPVLVIDSPSGNAQRQERRFRDWTQANKFILVMMVECKNNVDWKIGYGNLCSMFQDLTRRFKIAKKSTIISGFSGGGRRCSVFADKFPEIIAAAFHHGGVVGGNMDFSNREDFFTATASGDTCFNLGETAYLEEKMKERGFYSIFHGGHAWVPKHIVNQSLDFLMYKLSVRKKERLPKELVAKFVLNQVKILKGSESVPTKFKIIEGLTEVLRERADVEYLPKFKKLPGFLRYQMMLLKKKTKGAKSEMIAMKMFEESFYSTSVLDYCRVVRTSTNSYFERKKAAQARDDSRSVREAAIEAMKKIVERFPETEGGKLAANEIKRLESLEHRLLRGGF